ncbi:unnamed protein product [Amoebophrya sp. A120]|nr:unnamed protein product [Amoebophrya sp. A120]|eukprot:GSA120T00016949001.1
MIWWLSLGRLWQQLTTSTRWCEEIDFLLIKFLFLFFLGTCLYFEYFISDDLWILLKKAWTKKKHIKTLVVPVFEFAQEVQDSFLIDRSERNKVLFQMSAMLIIPTLFGLYEARHQTRIRSEEPLLRGGRQPPWAVVRTRWRKEHSFAQGSGNGVRWCKPPPEAVDENPPQDGKSSSSRLPRKKVIGASSTTLDDPYRLIPPATFQMQMEKDKHGQIQWYDGDGRNYTKLVRSIEAQAAALPKSNQTLIPQKFRAWSYPEDGNERWEAKEEAEKAKLVKKQKIAQQLRRVVLHDGNQMPLVAFGTGTGTTTEALANAILLGHIRHLDSAIWYGEDWLGTFLESFFAQHKPYIGRQDLFITTKVEPSDDDVRMLLEREFPKSGAETTNPKPGVAYVRMDPVTLQPLPESYRKKEEKSLDQVDERDVWMAAQNKKGQDKLNWLIYRKVQESRSQLGLIAGGKIKKQKGLPGARGPAAVQVHDRKDQTGERPATSSTSVEQQPHNYEDFDETAEQDEDATKLDMLLAHSMPAQERHWVPFWKALMFVKREGLVKSIGVSNWSVKALDRLKQFNLELPTVNQFQFHPFFKGMMGDPKIFDIEETVDAETGKIVKKEQQKAKDIVHYCNEHQIVITAYSPLQPLQVVRSKWLEQQFARVTDCDKAGKLMKKKRTARAEKQAGNQAKKGKVARKLVTAAEQRLGRTLEVADLEKDDVYESIKDTPEFEENYLQLILSLKSRYTIMQDWQRKEFIEKDYGMCRLKEFWEATRQAMKEVNALELYMWHLEPGGAAPARSSHASNSTVSGAASSSNVAKNATSVTTTSSKTRNKTASLPRGIITSTKNPKRAQLLNAVSLDNEEARAAIAESTRRRKSRNKKGKKMNKDNGGNEKFIRDDITIWDPNLLQWSEEFMIFMDARTFFDPSTGLPKDK